MIRKIVCLILFGIIVIFPREISFQLYLFDTENNQSLETGSEIEVKSAFVDTDGNRFFELTQFKQIDDGILHLNISVNVDSKDDLFVFDNKDLTLHLNLLNDDLIIPMTSTSLAILSELTDKTVRMADESILKVDYENQLLQVGGSPVTKDVFNVTGSIKARYFVGNGEPITNVLGSGFNDDHSLERLYSRTCPPSNSAAYCSYGEDVLFVSNNQFVGINTVEPQMSLDTYGRVLFTNGETNAGTIDFDLKKGQSIMAWDHQTAALKVGYVTRDASVQKDSFSLASLSIGQDILTRGLNSGVLGGYKNTIQGDYSSILGGENNIVTGDYSVLIGSENELVYKAYVTNIAGNDNIVSSNYALLLSSSENQLQGNHQAIIGQKNLISGSDIFVFGNLNQVSSDNVIVMGDAVQSNRSNTWVINLSSDQLASPVNESEVLWVVTSSVMINSTQSREVLDISGEMKATSFFADGALLSNAFLVDKYWFMDGDAMLNEGYFLGLDTQGLNRLNLKNGMVLSDDHSTTPGTFFYNGDLIGVAQTATHSLSIQDTDTQYNVSYLLTKYENNISLSTSNVQNSDFIVFDGQSWVYSSKNTWREAVDGVSHDRPISFWQPDKYFGRLTLSHSILNAAQFINSDESKGISIRLGDEKDKSQVIAIGMNIDANDSSFNRYDNSSSGYQLEFDSLSGGIFLQDHLKTSLLEIESDGKINLFEPVSNLNLNIPTVSQLVNLIVDEGVGSNFRLLTYFDNPMIHLKDSAELIFNSANNEPILFRVLPESYTLKSEQDRLKIKPDGEVLLSDVDLVSLNQPMLTHPDGDMLIDNGQEIGLFDDSSTRQSAIQLNVDSVEIIPASTTNDLLTINESGLGIRVVPDRGLVVVDEISDTEIFIEKSPGVESSGFVLSREGSGSKWQFVSNEASNASSSLGLINATDQIVMQWDDSSKLGINEPSSKFRSLNINGDIAQTASELKMMQAADPTNIGTAKPVIKVAGDQSKITGMDDNGGVDFRIDDEIKLNVKDGVVSIGSDLAPDLPTKNLYVKTGSYINDGLYYYDEQIDYKTIKTDVVSYFHSTSNIRQELGFDFDTGFEVISTEDYSLTLSFESHFSTFNTIGLTEYLDEDTVYITPEGIDTMGFSGDYISVLADNYIGAGDSSLDLDSLSFYNDLMNGGIIDGDIYVVGTVNVFGVNSAGQPHKIIGDISKMHSIPFPWEHVSREDGVLVDYEYVITENVGIGTKTPDYPLEVDGVSSINIVIAHEGRVSGDVVSNGDSFLLKSYQETIVTVNQSTTETAQLFQLNQWFFRSNKFGLNSLNSNYFLTFFPYFTNLDSLIYIHSKTKSMLNFDDNLNIFFDMYGDLTFYNRSNLKEIYLKSNDTTLNISPDDFVALNTNQLAKNSLDVSGNVVVGVNLSSKHDAPDNSVMIESKFGVNTFAPIGFADVRGSMVVGQSNQYMGNIFGLDHSLIIETKLFLEEYFPDDANHNFQINGPIVIDGGLYFNKSSNLNSNELSFFDNQSNRYVIGYGSDVIDRTLTISSDSFLDLSPADGVVGLYSDNSGRFGLGHNLPTQLFHIKKPNIELRIESTKDVDGDAYINFKSAGLGIVGYSKETNVSNQMIFTDGENPILGGADFAIDLSGQVDIGYNVSDPNAALPSHNVKVDVFEKVHVKNVIRENAQVLTHMPEGSVVMWSGWTADLPDGWYFCVGVDDVASKSTSACNFVDYFIVGKNALTETLNTAVPGAAHSYSVVTKEPTVENGMDGYHHTHSNTHNHNSFSQASHSHQQHNLAQRTGNFNTTSNKVSSKTKYDGASHHRYEYERCWGKKWGWFCETKEADGDNPAFSRYIPKNGGNHKHEITIDHGHSVSVNNNSHNHTLQNKTHTHDAYASHSHTVNNQPEFYTLAFIYLKGEGQ